MEDAPLGEWDGVKVVQGGDAVAELKLTANSVSGQVLDMSVMSCDALFANIACVNIEDNNTTGILPTTGDMVQGPFLGKCCAILCRTTRSTESVWGTTISMVWARSLLWYRR